MKKQIAMLSFAFAASAFLVSCKSGNEKEVAESGPLSPIPYTVELVEYVNPALPNLHSFTHATYEDKIIMLGGRRKGLHASSYNFSGYSSNEIIYVIDTKGWDANPANWQVSSQNYTSTVKADPSSGFIYPEQFHANNMEFFTQNDILYMIGGYVNISDTPRALPAITGVNLKDLVAAVMGHSSMPVGSVRQTTNPALAITGGEVGLMNNTVYLAFGWDGNNYTHQVSSLTFTDNVAAKSLAITLNPACATCSDGVLPTAPNDSGYFRRRDGNMSAMISPKDSSNLFMYFAGVFKNGNTNFDTPISITANAAQEDSLHMRGNVYTCKVIPAWSRSAKMSYATFLGGMTNSKYGTITSPELLSNSNSTVLPVDTTNYLSVPFSNRFTTVVMDANKNLTHYLLPDSFPATIASMTLAYTPPKHPKNDSTIVLPVGSNPFNGAEAEIIWRIPSSSNYRNSGVIDLDDFFKNNPQGGSVGYLYGGLLSVVTNVNMNNNGGVPTNAAFVPNYNDKVTIASNRIFAVKIIPIKTTK